ncbi:MAG: efflux RND transporter periplasmic adaptor subunit [Pseudomonadota bacterium]
MQVGLQSDLNKLSLPGEIRARYESPLAFRVAGKVAECKVKLGETVKRGQILASLEATDYQLAAQSGAAGEAEAQSSATFAEADLARYRVLYDKGFVSKAVLEQKQAAADAARARLNAVKASHTQQNRQVGYTALSAERDGVLTGLDCNPGQVVAAGQPIMRLAQGSEREVEVQVPESALVRFKSAKRFAVELNALPGSAYAGALRELAATADPVLRTYTARLTLDKPDAALQLGMSATAVVELTGEQVVRLPLAAVFSRDGKAKVWKVDSAKTVHAVLVQTGQMEENRIRILAGLQDGDVVVTAGANLLREGQQVRLMP